MPERNFGLRLVTENSNSCKNCWDCGLWQDIESAKSPHPDVILPKHIVAAKKIRDRGPGCDQFDETVVPLVRITFGDNIETEEAIRYAQVLRSDNIPKPRVIK